MELIRYTRRWQSEQFQWKLKSDEFNEHGYCIFDSHGMYGYHSLNLGIICCHCCKYWMTEWNISDKLAKIQCHSNWNSPMSSCGCVVTIIATPLVQLARGHVVNLWQTFGHCSSCCRYNSYCLQVYVSLHSAYKILAFPWIVIVITFSSNNWTSISMVLITATTFINSWQSFTVIYLKLWEIHPNRPYPLWHCWGIHDTISSRSKMKKTRTSLPFGNMDKMA